MPSFGMVTLRLNLQPSLRLQRNLTFLSRDPKLGHYLKMIAQRCMSDGHSHTWGAGLKDIMTNTVRIARLKLLFYCRQDCQRRQSRKSRIACQIEVLNSGYFLLKSTL
jgi:hypothetical protein